MFRADHRKAEVEAGTPVRKVLQVDMARNNGGLVEEMKRRQILHLF